jgi:hypothetical protein
MIEIAVQCLLMAACIALGASARASSKMMRARYAAWRELDERACRQTRAALSNSSVLFAEIKRVQKEAAR